MAFRLTSPAFRDGERLPDRYVRKGGNVSPPLSWRGAPPNTRSFALIVEDPDAPKGTFRHWAIYDLPPAHTSLPENAGRGNGRPYHAAVNDFGVTKYDGPQPPPGDGVHHYHFRLAALDVEHLDLPENATAEAVWHAASPHMLDETEIVATFEQRRG